MASVKTCENTFGIKPSVLRISEMTKIQDCYYQSSAFVASKCQIIGLRLITNDKLVEECLTKEVEDGNMHNDNQGRWVT